MSCIKISKKALIHNLFVISKKAKNKKFVAAVLKDNAYGHGIELIASIVSEFGIDKAVVRDFKEAKKIEGFFKYILVLNGEAKGFVATINSLEDLKNFSSQAVEIKVDTGMHRNGIKIDELEEAFNIAYKRGFDVKGVFTHFRSADILSSELFWQVQNFKKVKHISKKLAKKYGYKLHFHSANSAALFRFGCMDDFVRVGIAMYGALEMDEVFGKADLKPVLSLWADKIATKRLKKGQRVGYAGEFEADEDMDISTYDVGYGDGLFRDISGMRVEDKKILGRVSMDNLVINSTKDKICIFNDAKEVAKYCNTISYEILVHLSPHIKRVIV